MNSLMKLSPDACQVAMAIELFHNFTLIHDDIMDKAPLRRGQQTVHEKYGEPTALLAGDVMMVVLMNISIRSEPFLHKVINLFNKTAKEVCEGQQLDMDFEKMESVSFDEYIKMIELKTSVLLAAEFKNGSILGGAGEGNQKLLYEFGRNLGLHSRSRMITWMHLVTRKNLVRKLVEIFLQIKKLFY